MTITILNMETVYSGWAKYSRASFRLAGGETVRREIEEHGRVAAVLPYDERRKTAILVRQFRAPVFVAAGEGDLLEAIAGLLDYWRERGWPDLCHPMGTDDLVCD